MDPFFQNYMVRVVERTVSHRRWVLIRRGQEEETDGEQMRQVALKAECLPCFGLRSWCRELDHTVWGLTTQKLGRDVNPASDSKVHGPPTVVSTYIPFSYGSRGMESVPLSVLWDGRAVLVGEPWAGDQETAELVLALYCLAVWPCESHFPSLNCSIFSAKWGWSSLRPSHRHWGELMR